MFGNIFLIKLSLNKNLILSKLIFITIINIEKLSSDTRPDIITKISYRI